MGFYVYYSSKVRLCEVCINDELSSVRERGPHKK